MNWHKVAVRILAALFFFMLAGAIGTHLLFRQAPLEGTGSASFLFLAGALILLTVPRTDYLRLFLAGVLGFISEIIGVRYGWLYGRYEYTDVLAPNLFEVPVVMICAWFILISYTQQLLSGLGLMVWLEVLLGGLWMTMIDLVLDPLAAHPFKFWQWNEDGLYYGIPAQNFLGWFIVSSLILAVDKIAFPTPRTALSGPQLIGICIILLYTSCSFAYGYFVPGIFGLVLMGLHGFVVFCLKFLGYTAVPKTEPTRIMN